MIITSNKVAVVVSSTVSKNSGNYVECLQKIGYNPSKTVTLYYIYPYTIQTGPDKGKQAYTVYPLYPQEKIPPNAINIYGSEALAMTEATILTTGSAGPYPANNLYNIQLNNSILKSVYQEYLNSNTSQTSATTSQPIATNTSLPVTTTISSQSITSSASLPVTTSISTSTSTSSSYTKITYNTIEFIETGLPTGTEWSVTLNSQTKSSTSNKIVFNNLHNGQYSYSINANGYKANKPNGTIII